MNRKRRTKETIGLLLDRENHPTNKDIGKAEMLNAFFAFVFNTSYGLWDPRCPEFKNCDCNKLPANLEFMWDLLLQLDS